MLLVEDEGDFGPLYIANFGKPFTHDNVVALSRIGLSTKPPGNSIGNGVDRFRARAAMSSSGFLTRLGGTGNFNAFQNGRAYGYRSFT